MKTYLNMRPLYKEMEFPLRSLDFDYNDRLKPSAILDYFQQIAASHASDLAVGYNDLIKENIVWVILRTSFEIIEYPSINDIIVVTTRPRKPSLASFDRDYEIKSRDGKILLTGTSKWILMNKTTRKIVRYPLNFEGEYLKSASFNNEKISLDFSFDTLPKTSKITNTSLDHSGHLNNAKYADIILDTLDNLDFKIKEFSINYVSEVKNKDIIKIYHKKTDYHYFQGIHNDKICFIARIKTEEE